MTKKATVRLESSGVAKQPQRAPERRTSQVKVQYAKDNAVEQAHKSVIADYAEVFAALADA